MIDNLTEGDVAGFEQRCGAADFQNLRDIADGESEIKISGFRNTDFDALAFQAREASQFGVDLIDAG